MGGLTVLAALRARMPRENFVYLGDTARLPYGTKTSDTVSRYASRAAGQLVSRGVKALVIACNTASAVALESLRAEFSPLPVFGVVEPGAIAAIKVADASGVLVLATESTILGGAYQRALGKAGARFSIYGRACPLWVTLAEQGPTDAELTDVLLRHYLRGIFLSCRRFGGPRTLLLGCTHFPVFRQALEKILQTDVHEPVSIVDSAQTTAESVTCAMKNAGLLQPELSTQANTSSGSCEYLATDGVDRFAQIGQYFLDQKIDRVEWVDL